jgi:hypothetical protein
MRYLWRLLDPAGDIPTVELNYANEGGPRGEVHLENVALTLPQLTRQGSAIPAIDDGPSVLEVLTGEDNTALYRLDPERPRIDPSDYQARLSNVTGVLKFDDRGFQLEDLTGRALDEDIAYEINGHVYGYTEDAPFELTAETERIRIPRRPRYLVALPGDLQRLFRKFSPAGDARAAITLRRTETGGPVAVNGRVDILDAEARYFEFPYPLHNLTGTIEFTNDEIRLVDLVADAPGGGTIGLKGRVWPPGRHAAVDLTILANDVPWNDALRRALPDDRRSAVDKFFHQPSYDRLAKAGLLKQPDGSSFEMGGRADATIRITAPAGADVKETIAGTLHCRDGGFIVKYFPYPIRDAEGIIRFENDRVAFEEVKGRGPNGGTVTFDGSIREVDANGGSTAAPDVQIRATDVPVDELLHAVLPESARPLVRRLNVEGTFDIGGRVFTRPDHRPDIDLTLTLADATAHPVQPAKQLTELSGNIGITLDRTEIHEVTASYGDGRLSASGVLNWTSTGPPDAHIRIVAENMTCEPSLMHLVSAANPDLDIAGLWEQYEPAGRFDARLDYAQTGDETRSYGISVEPKQFSFNLDDQRVELDELSGRVDWRPGRFELTDLNGKLGPAAIAVSGEVLTDDGWDVALRNVKVASPRITPVVRKALPDPVRRILDGLEWKGDFQADLQTLHHRPNAATGERTRVVGEVRTTDASLELGVPIRHMTGVIGIDVRQQADAAWPQIDLSIDAERLEAAGRQLTALHAELRNNRAGEDVLLPVIRGNVCGGELSGTGAVNLADQAYQVRLTVNNGELGRFLAGDDEEQPEQREDEENGKRPAPTGTVAADLVIEGRWDSPDDRRARGQILVQDAELYDLPLALGLLNLTHLSLPTTRSFNRAAVSYYMEGDEVRFEKLVLDSPQVRLQGEGTMQFSTQTLDLALTSANPSAPGLGPMTELIDGLRNQFITIHVTGTLDDPETQVKQFSGIARAWEDVFGDGAE